MSIGYFDVAVDLSVEFLYQWVRREIEKEGISFNNESFDGSSEVRDVTLGDIVLRLIQQG